MFTYKGKPLDEYSKDELMDIILEMQSNFTCMMERHQHERETMQRIHKDRIEYLVKA